MAGEEEWQDRAACHGLEPAVASRLFHPNGYGPDYERDIDAARTYCARCEVEQVCLSYAVATRQDWGTWGGLTEWERRTQRPQLRRHFAGVPAGDAPAKTYVQVTKRGNPKDGRQTA